MLRILILMFALGSSPALASLVSYDYYFDYYDISDCESGCSPEPGAGVGHLKVDKSNNSLKYLSLHTDSFQIDWSGHALFSTETEDAWPEPDGSRYYAWCGLNLGDQTVSLFLDLFFVPEAGHPLDYFENAEEHTNTVNNDRGTWELTGRFHKVAPAQVPEPTPLMLLLGGTGLLLARRRKNSWWPEGIARPRG